RSTPEPWDIVEVGIPGEAALPNGTTGPRHDNDHPTISDIQLLPTSAECLSRLSPLVPGNFPFHKNAHWLPPGTERWVDTHFRLYREDLCCTLRTCLQDLEHRLISSHGNIAGGHVRDAEVDYNLYPILDTYMPLRHTMNRAQRDPEKPVEYHGLCMDVRFPHPTVAEMTGKYDIVMDDNATTRRQLWESTGRLPFNAMVGLVVYSECVLQVVFCKIIVRNLDRLANKVSEVTLQPHETRDFVILERWQSTTFSRQVHDGNYPLMFLMEFNKILYAAYEPILRALQTIKPTTMPFQQYLAPDVPPISNKLKMEPPTYCFAPQFKFNLSSVLQSHPKMTGGVRHQLHLRPLHEKSRNECEDSLVKYSTLERDQAKALVRALTSRVACIQGLPGTGKSFIGSMLTRIIVEAKVSPVLVVCYTNHALDQFLCHLLDAGITSVVRIGGQSKEARLAKYNLTNVRKFTPRYELKYLYENLDTYATGIGNVLRDLSVNVQNPTWKSLKWYLQANYPDEYDHFEARRTALFRSGWQVAGCNDILDYWIKGRDGGGHTRRPSAQKDLQSNVWVWDMNFRRVTLSKWVEAIRSDRLGNLVRAQKDYSETLKKIEAVKEEADVEVLKRVQIIGMTTTGVAKYQEKIVAVAPPVVICEEAGQVLEAQLMACLTPASCQHLVLIGDHKQLRPQITEYNLSVESAVGKRFALDVSLFERLVAPNSGLPFWMLTEQHRMRPQISQLLRMLFYPEVRDAREVLNTPPLLGLEKNVFFVNHCHAEGDASGTHALTRYHSNDYEVEYIVGTLKYLVQQGYQPSDIAIITPYVGQLMKLRLALRGQFVLELNEFDNEELQKTFGNDEKDTKLPNYRNNPAALGASKRDLSGSIRVATVDNFQGEEATVILVSLVRSSSNVHGRGKIGFLKTPNRINVLLSRAKHGLILVGHGELLRTKSPLWEQVLNKLQSDGCYGDGLPLYCQRHPDDQRIAANPGSFSLLAPDGGCLRPCGRRLPDCGHVCPKLCHVDQPSHKSVYCTQPCPRLQNGCGHVCPGVCGDPCGRCNVQVGSITLPCGHSYNNARCFEAKAPSKLNCKVLVDKKVNTCGHMQRVTCSAAKIKCTRNCGEVLPCGHACSRKCNDCIEKTLKSRKGKSDTYFPIKPTVHGSCQKKCERLLPCCHRCRGVCHGKAPCSPCQQICDVFSCEHGSCTHPCSDPCAACTERCSWSCEHCIDCPLPCGAPCNRRLCDRRCTKSLSCGHQCPSICGEDCPSQEFCHTCGNDDVKQRVADVILFQTYGEIDPSEDPVLVLPCCSMVYTMATLDGTLHMSTYYDENGYPRGALPGGYIDTPQCPNCNKPIRGLRRYGRVTKRAAIDAAEKKFIVHAQQQLTILQRRTQTVIERGDPSYDANFEDNLNTFGLMVQRPPCQKLFEACVALLTKSKGGQGGGDIDIDYSTLPVPNSNFRFEGYYNLFSAQLQLSGSKASASAAEKYAKKAIKQFVSGSYSQQAGEAQLVLVQIYLSRADKILSESVKTEEDRKKRQVKVEQYTHKANDLLKTLDSYGASFQRDHAENLLQFQQKIEIIVKKARSATFYQKISEEEIKAVKTAMQSEFRGSGHWYRCVNGHSYSIGECGMAMEQTRCPECGAPVGGANHNFVEGTERDEHMDSL
ncbi:hypothetical protein PHMEG_00019462, partial [Phytophthora megakarya]